MNTFLIATDGSPAAQAAVRAGVQLAEEQGARVVLLHVVEPVDVVAAAPFGPLVALPHVAAPPHRDDALVRASLVAREHGVPFEVRVVPSLVAADAIVRVAEELDAELIAIGSSRHGAVASSLLGSVSKCVLAHSRRPVLVVHESPAPRFHRPRPRRVAAAPRPVYERTGR